MRFRKDDPRAELAALELFAGCSRAELGRISLLLTTVHVPAGYVLMREGDRGDEFVVLLDGRASVHRRTPFGDEEIALLGPGDFVGEMALLHDGTGPRRNATVVAASPLTCAVCTPGEFRQILALVPSVEDTVRRSADRRAMALLATA